jgi:gas vesicle protein
MTRTGKIEKWGLEDEVRNMLDEKKSYSQIAKHINNKYNDIPELTKVNKMTISRYVEKMDEKDMKEKIDEVKDPAKVIQSEFNQRIRENILDAEHMNNLVNSYSNKLETGDLTTKELSTMIKAWKDTNDQIRKNLVNLREFTDHRVIKPTQNIIYKKEINIKNMLVDFARELCPSCKKKVSNLLEEIENEN